MKMTPTPWGSIQSRTTVADGILSVSTARHGGILISPDRYEEMPAPVKRVVTWAGHLAYEEDRDWALVALAFPEHFDDSALDAALRYTDPKLDPWPDFDLAAYLETPQGKSAAVRVKQYREAIKDLYRPGGCYTAGNGWILHATHSSTGEHVSLRFDSYADMPTEPFDLDAYRDRIVS